MRFYGTIETNLMNLIKDISDIHYSIDSLMFETPDGDTFRIDFEEGDYAVEEDSITFRLKSLGITFEEDWLDLGTTDGVDFENDYDFFSLCNLINIFVYLPDEVAEKIENIKDLKFKMVECDLYLGEDSVSYDAPLVEVEY